MKLTYVIEKSDMDDFLQRIEDIVRNALNDSQAHSKSTSIPDSPKYLTIETACERLHISKSTIYRLIRTGALPCLKIGKRTLFKTSDIDSTIMHKNVL